MSDQKATLEQVRNAYDTLSSAGKTVSAANIIKLVGGSKTTVVKQLQTVRQERLAEKPAVEIPLALLQSLSEPLVRKIWQEAESLANALHQQRARSLEAMQLGLMADLEDSRQAEEAALARVNELEGRLNHRDEFEAQLGSLRRMVDELGDRGGRKQPAAPGTAVTMVLRVLSGQADPVGKQEIDKQMLENGFSAAAAQKARWHAVDRGLAEAVGETLRLTVEGRHKLNQSPTGGRAATASSRT